MCQELPEKSMVQLSDCFRGYEKKRISYKDIGTQLHGKQVLLFHLAQI